MLGITQHLLSVLQPSQLRHRASFLLVLFACPALALSLTEVVTGFSVLHTERPFFLTLLRGNNIPSASIRVSVFLTTFVLASSVGTCMVVIFKYSTISKRDPLTQDFFCGSRH